MRLDLNKPIPTHSCKQCGAMWRFWRKEETAAELDDSWSLCSDTCGKCCDMEPMGEQIIPATFQSLFEWLATA